MAVPLIVHLGVLKRQGFLDLWYDREISSGSEWAKEIDKHLNAAEIILLLVSQYFMASDYCYLVQMQKAIERHERGEVWVIPIILRPVYYERAPFAKLQTLPTNVEPVTTWQDLDKAFENIAQDIRNIIKDMSTRLSKYTEDSRKIPDIHISSTENQNEVLDILLIGAPGAGKGTQAEKLTQLFGIRHIASGDLFRQAFEEQTELGLKAQRYVDLGELVPDGITIPMVIRHIEEPESMNGVVLDGFPRTLVQALALDEELQRLNRKPDLVIYLKVSRETLLQRIGGRVFCQANQHIYHVKNRPPKVSGICDLDGSKLYQRPDDAGEAMRRRLVIYFNLTVQVLDYYSQQQKLREIDGNQSIDQVHKALVDEINAYTSSMAKS